MPRPSPLRIQFGLRGWAAIAAALVLLAAVIFLAIGLFVFLLPVLLLAPILYWLLPKPKIYRISNPASAAEGATVIDGEFRVMDVSPVQEAKNNLTSPPEKRS
jgi:hypothetical protein